MRMETLRAAPCPPPRRLSDAVRSIHPGSPRLAPPHTPHVLATTRRDQLLPPHGERRRPTPTVRWLLPRETKAGANTSSASARRYDRSARCGSRPEPPPTSEPRLRTRSSVHGREAERPSHDRRWRSPESSARVLLPATAQQPHQQEQHRHDRCCSLDDRRAGRVEQIDGCSFLVFDLANRGLGWLGGFR